MESSELKSVIAQNCPEYDPIYAITMMSMRALSEKCSNCTHFIKEKCAKNLYEEMKEKISRN